MKLLFIVLLIAGMQAEAQLSISLLKKEIQQSIQLTDQTKGMRKIVLEQEDFTPYSYDGGATLTGYYNKGKLQKLGSWFGLSNGYTSTDYYVRGDGILIKVQEISCRYGYNDSTNQLRYNQVDTSFNGSYWFWNGKLIDQTFIGHNRFEADKIDPEKEFLADIKKYTRLLNAKFRR